MLSPHMLSAIYTDMTSIFLTHSPLTCFLTSRWKVASGTKREGWWPLQLLIAMQTSASETLSKGSTCRMVTQNRSSKMKVTRAPPVRSLFFSSSLSLGEVR
jgi:hypothetical protein